MKKIATILLILSSLICVSQDEVSPNWINYQKQQPRPRQDSDFDINKIMYDPFIEQEMQRIQQQNAYLIQQEEQRVRQQNAYFRQAAQQQKQLMAQHLLTNGFPSPRNVDSLGIGYFHNAFAEIDSMLSGTKELNLARSIFLVENAFYGNTLNYSDYQSFIKRKVEFCNRIMKESKQDANDNLVKNLAIFRLLTETVPFKNSKREKTEYHLPIQYDYDDYQSKEHHDSHFITKLMASNVGQCYSMPLYYLIIAEAMNAEAYWSLSPHHGFVKIKDKKENWYNIELTCQSILTDAHYASNSYIKVEALRNRIYLEPLDKEQTIAYQLVNLAQTYFKKYGLDYFYLKCINSALQYTQNNVEALKMRASYYQNLLIRSAQLLEKQDLQSFGKLQPLANKILDQLEVYYEEIDGLGYEKTPDMIYEIWLEHIEKQKIESEKNKTILLDIVR